MDARLEEARDAAQIVQRRVNCIEWRSTQVTSLGAIVGQLAEAVEMLAEERIEAERDEACNGRGGGQ